jgi:hypothetical protein
MKCFILQITLCFSPWVHAQDYFEYQRVFNRIDGDILNEKYDNAIQRLDSIYDRYEFIYAKHCIKALQICCKADDSIRADKFLEKCFRQGVPLWLIRVNDLTSKTLKYSTTRHTFRAYDSLRAVYTSSINQELARQIDSLIEIDQGLTNKVNNAFFPFRVTYHYIKWRRNNTKEFKLIHEIIKKYGFPGERLIGLSSYYEDSSKAAANMIFYGPHPVETRTFTMLLHCYSSPRENMNELLLNSARNGYMLPFHYASINDFISEYGEIKTDSLYYNAWHNAPKTTPIDQINKRRNLIGLNLFEEQENHDMIKIDRRRNRLANSEIILE